MVNFLHFQGPCITLCGCAKHSHLRPWPPSRKPGVHPFHHQSAGRLNARVCRIVSPALPLPVCARISRWLAHVPACYWNYDWYGAACSGSHHSTKGRQLPQRFHNSKKKKKKHYCKIVRPLAASLPSFPVLSMLCVCVCVDSRACLLCHRLPKLQPQECKITSTREISCL